ncbi:unnamed protein product [Camellia sinensis]
MGGWVQCWVQCSLYSNQITDSPIKPNPLSSSLLLLQNPRKRTKPSNPLIDLHTFFAFEMKATQVLHSHKHTSTTIDHHQPLPLRAWSSILIPSPFHGFEVLFAIALVKVYFEERFHVAIIFPGESSENLLPPLPALKHLKLEIISALSTTCSTIVDGLVWIFPGLDTLTIKSASTISSLRMKDSDGSKQIQMGFKNMEVTLPYISLSVFLLLVAFKFLSKARTQKNLPPSPPALPVISHLHLLKQPLHHTLHQLSQNLGSVFSLRFGSHLVVVVSSPFAVEECFTKNDVVLANRPRVAFGKYLGYNYTTIVAASFGDHWRNLHRIMVVEIFSTSRLNAFLSIRQDEIKLLLPRLSQNSSRDFKRVELKPKESN